MSVRLYVYLMTHHKQVFRHCRIEVAVSGESEGISDRLAWRWLEKCGNTLSH